MNTKYLTYFKSHLKSFRRETIIHIQMMSEKQKLCNSVRCVVSTSFRHFSLKSLDGENEGLADCFMHA